MIKRLILAAIVVGVMASPALARHHKKKATPTPTPSPSVRLENPRDVQDHGG